MEEKVLSGNLEDVEYIVSTNPPSNTEPNLSIRIDLYKKDFKITTEEKFLFFFKRKNKYRIPIATIYVPIKKLIGNNRETKTLTTIKEKIFESLKQIWNLKHLEIGYI